MKTTTRRTVRGELKFRDLGSGTWHLTTGMAAGPEIYVVDAEPKATETLRHASFVEVVCEWRNEGVRVTLITAAGTEVLTAGNAIIHEPLPRLYEGLPLASLDEAARRFWRRVFRLVRIPGGRHLLGLIARRASPPK
jgi:hypothetical protein